MSHLQVTNRFLAFEDSSINNNPQQRHFDWSRQHQGLPIACPANEPFRIQPFETIELFDGTRNINSDLTTQYTVSNIFKNVYRLKWTGTGSEPGFRDTRGLTPSAYPVTITLAPQTNQPQLVPRTDTT